MDVGNDICIMDGKYLCVWYFNTCTLVYYRNEIVVTVGTFETAKRRPTFFIRDGYHTPSRSRNMYYNGKKIKLDPNDVGGEHENNNV